MDQWSSVGVLNGAEGRGGGGGGRQRAGGKIIIIFFSFSPIYASYFLFVVHLLQQTPTVSRPTVGLRLGQANELWAGKLCLGRGETLAASCFLSLSSSGRLFSGSFSFPNGAFGSAPESLGPLIIFGLDLFCLLLYFSKLFFSLSSSILHARKPQVDFSMAPNSQQARNGRPLSMRSDLWRAFT